MIPKSLLINHNQFIFHEQKESAKILLTQTIISGIQFEARALEN